MRALASTCASLPVNLLRQRALAPFIMVSVFSLSVHASHPYVNSEHIAVLYILSFSSSGMPESNTLRRAPIRCIAMAIRLCTSHSSLPSAVKMDPRYLNAYVFLRASPSHSTVCLCTCAFFNFCCLTAFSAQVPVKCWTSGLKSHHRM